MVCSGRAEGPVRGQSGASPGPVRGQSGARQGPVRGQSGARQGPVSYRVRTPPSPFGRCKGLQILHYECLLMFLLRSLEKTRRSPAVTKPAGGTSKPFGGGTGDVPKYPMIFVMTSGRSTRDPRSTPTPPPGPTKSCALSAWSPLATLDLAIRRGIKASIGGKCKLMNIHRLCYVIMLDCFQNR